MRLSGHQEALRTSTASRAATRRRDRDRGHRVERVVRPEGPGVGGYLPDEGVPADDQMGAPGPVG